MCRLIESGQNNSMTVYECQVYPNTPMGDEEYKKKYGIKTARIPLFGIHYNIRTDVLSNCLQNYFSDHKKKNATMQAVLSAMLHS